MDKSKASLLLLLAVAALQVAILILAWSKSDAGRFVPVPNNPYLALDTTTGKECLRVVHRRREMIEWITGPYGPERVGDSYAAAIDVYAEKNKSGESKESDRENLKRLLSEIPACDDLR